MIAAGYCERCLELLAPCGACRLLVCIHCDSTVEDHRRYCGGRKPDG